MKTQFSPLPNDRRSRLIVSVALGVLVFALVVLFACLVANSDDDSSRGGSSRACPAPAGTVDPVTCLPYGSSATVAPGTNNSGSSAQRPAQKPQAPAPKAPAPAAPVVKVPAAPPVRIK